MYENVCRECGKTFAAKRKHGKYCCEECRAEGNRRKVREASRVYHARQKLPKAGRLDSGKMGLAEINQKARDEGMTYGPYVAKHGL